MADARTPPFRLHLGRFIVFAFLAFAVCFYGIPLLWLLLAGTRSQSSLFAVDKGSFAFVAGRMATAGSLRTETPVGSIRGRAQAGGFGMLSLTALTFAMMSDAKAADPDATFLDDDNIAYRDCEHGAFELWTK